MSATITSLQNARVKDAARLRDRRGRDKQQRIIIDGAREVLRAIESNAQIVELFVCSELCHNTDCHQAIETAGRLKVDTTEVTAQVFQKLAFGHRSEGIIAIANTPKRNLSDLQLDEIPLVVVLDNIEKPGNLGAVIRSADGAGASAVMAANLRTDLFNPNAIRASLGTIFSTPAVAASAGEIRRWLTHHQLAIYAADADGDIQYSDVDFTNPTAIVLGSEAHGLSTEWRNDQIKTIKLPMLGIADSLNLSATAAVLLYESLRQRRQMDSSL